MFDTSAPAVMEFAEDAGTPKEFADSPWSAGGEAGMITRRTGRGLDAPDISLDPPGPGTGAERGRYGVRRLPATVEAPK